MSFYTALTGLNGSQADIAATSNNIANVGTTGFKRSRAEFGDIFATSPLQNSSSSIGSGSILKGVKQQFQGSLIAFVVLLFWFANRQEAIDEEFGFAEKEED